MSATSAALRLEGFLTLHLFGASREQASRLAWELGVEPAEIGPEQPDLTIEFADGIEPPDAAVRLGDVAIDTDGTLYLSGFAGARRAWTEIKPWTPLEPMTIRTDRRNGRPPLFQDLVNILLFARGTPAVHATSLVIDGKGVLVPGWMGGRKTEVLLGLVGVGARAMADEWTVLHDSPLQMTGIASPVRLDRRHLGLMPDAAGLSRRRRLRVTSTSVAARAVRGLGRGKRMARAVERSLQNRSHVDVAPASVFRENHLSTSHPVSLVAMVHPTADARTDLREISVGEMAHRLAYVHAEHRRGLTSAVAALGYVDPERASNAAVPSVDTERQLLTSLLAEVPCYLLRLPPVVDPAELAELVRDRLAS